MVHSTTPVSISISHQPVICLICVFSIICKEGRDIHTTARKESNESNRDTPGISSTSISCALQTLRHTHLFILPPPSLEEGRFSRQQKASRIRPSSHPRSQYPLLKDSIYPSSSRPLWFASSCSHRWAAVRLRIARCWLLLV